MTTNDHVRAMVQAAAARGFQPRAAGRRRLVCSLEHLTLARALHWQWLPRLKANRLGNPDGSGNRPIRDVSFPAADAFVHLKSYGFINVFTMVTPDGGSDDQATSDLEMDAAQWVEAARYWWRSEAYHRGSTQFCGIERTRHRAACIQRNPIGLALRDFLRLEYHRLRKDTSWFEANAAIVLRNYLAQPRSTNRNYVTSVFFEIGSTMLLFIHTALTYRIGHPFNPGLPMLHRLACESYASAPAGHWAQRVPVLVRDHGTGDA